MNWIPLFIIALDLVVIFVQVLAFTLLINVKQNDVGGSQKILLIALCMTELTYILVDICEQSCFLMRINYVHEALWLFNASSITFMYIFIMTLIVMDRFLEIYLNIKYKIFWSPQKTKIVLIIALATCLLAFIPFFVIGLVLKESRFVASLMFYFIYPILELIFIVTCSCVYYYIIKQLVKLRRNTMKQQTQHQEKGSKPTYHKGFNYRFKIFVPTLIIVTFLLFMVVPNVIRLCAFLKMVKTEVAYIVSFTLIPIGFIADPCIYIFNLSAVRSLLRRKLCSS